MGKIPFRRIAYVIGCVFLIAGAFLFASTLVWEQRHKVQALVLPVSLKPGTIRTPEITAGYDETYYIVIDWPGDRLRGLSGDWPYSDTDISWKLLEGSRMVSRGHSVDPPWDRWGDTDEKVIGSFKGQAGHRYQLVLQINSDASGLDAANPTLAVQISPDYWEDFRLRPSIMESAAVLLGFIGVAFLAGATVKPAIVLRTLSVSCFLEAAVSFALSILMLIPDVNGRLLVNELPGAYFGSAIESVFLGLMVVSGILLWHLRRKGLAVLAWTLCAEVFYLLGLSIAGHYFGYGASFLSAALIVGSAGVDVQLYTIYPLFGGILIFLGYRSLRAPIGISM